MIEPRIEVTPHGRTKYIVENSPLYLELYERGYVIHTEHSWGTFDLHAFYGLREVVNESDFNAHLRKQFKGKHYWKRAWFFKTIEQGYTAAEWIESLRVMKKLLGEKNG